MRTTPATCIICAVLLAGMVPSVAFASDPPAYYFIDEDPAAQLAGGYTENYAFKWWTLSTVTEMLWWSSAAINADVEEVVNNWEGEIPDLEWMEVSAKVYADVDFEYADGTDGYPGETSFYSFYHSFLRQGSYWTKAHVILNTDYEWEDAGIDGCLAHEIGHLYGLHERYRTNPIECFSEVTIMDKAEVENGTVVGVCDDLEGPALIDETRVKQFWSEGSMQDIDFDVDGTVITWTWKDAAWAENHQNLQMFHSSEQGWVYYTGDDYVDDIGAHMDYPGAPGDRVMEWEVDPSEHQGVPTEDVWHSLCGRPWFPAWDAWGTWRCESVYFP